MAMGGAARTLHVPAADLLAKNMRALDAARAASTSVEAAAPASSAVRRASLLGLGVATETAAAEARKRARFRRAVDEPKPSAFSLLLARLFPTPPSKAQQAADEARRRAEKTQLEKTLQKVLPVLEKASALASRLPDPTVLFLALVLVVLLIDTLRPHWFDTLLGKAAAVASFVPSFALALLWRKTELFATLREGQNPLSHPTEHRLDHLEAELKEREERVRAAEETLRKNRAQLDALRKELAKDPNASEPDAVIVPSRKAAAMIAAGALGAGYDAEAAQAVEQRRREESVQRSREEWRARAEETESNIEQTKESISRLADHAATAYTKRTRELKSRSAAGTQRATDRLNLRKVANVVRNKENGEDSSRRLSRHSERSGAGSVANSASSRKKKLLFRRRRRESAASTPQGGRASPTGMGSITDEGLTPPPESVAESGEGGEM